MDSSHQISVVGAGPAGFALALDLQHHGKSVLLYSHPSHLRHANRVEAEGCLRARGAMNGTANVELTTDMCEVIAFSRIIILTVPSTGQETVLQELKQYDLRRHLILAIPGNMVSFIKDAGIQAENILETNLSPYSCRMDKGNLLVLGKKKVVYIAAKDNRMLTPACYHQIQSLFPMKLKWCSSVIEVCLSNVNGVFHPLMLLMNAGRIESTAGDFRLYCDGLTRSVANAMLAVDRVRMEIGRRLGLTLRSAIEISNECYGQSFVDLVDLAQRSPPHKDLKAPSDIENRNISEDVPDLLVCWHGLAEKLGIDAAPITAIIILAEMATGINYMETGRNLQKLGLDGVSRDDLIAMFNPRSDEQYDIDCRL